MAYYKIIGYDCMPSPRRHDLIKEIQHATMPGQAQNAVPTEYKELDLHRSDQHSSSQVSHDQLISTTQESMSVPSLTHWLQCKQI